MKICIITSQLAGYNKIGGFGSMTRYLAQSLVKKGLEVIVLAPKTKHEKRKERDMHGFTIIRLTFREMLAKKTYKKINADIYHSQNQNFITLLAEYYEPQKKHIVTCRDPRNWTDWKIEFKHATLQRKLKTPISYFFEEGPLGNLAVKKADVVGVPAHFLKKKVQKMHGLKKEPRFLPNIEKIPSTIPKKAKKPTVCWIGRLSKRKRPEIALKLAQQFPNVTFYIIGTEEEKQRERHLQRIAPQNVIFAGELNKFENKEFFDIVNKSWIILNTSAREGLPLTMIEAASRGCAILSYVNPDHFATKFGYHAKHHDFTKGLTYLLSHWQKAGEKAHSYVKKTYDYNIAIQTHLALYKEVTEQ